jgi:hypothetical protein
MSINDVLQSLWNKIRSWVDQNADKYIYALIPKERTDTSNDATPLKPYASYFRLWLSEMFLTKSVAWFQDVFPAVHSEVQLQFGDQQAVTFSSVAAPPRDQLARGIRLNYRLTELMPYNGGVVEIEAALLALKGPTNYLATAINVLQEFSGLISPPLGQVLTVAEKIATGTRDLLSATQGDVHLGLHQTFTSAGGGGQSVMAPGYIVVILATPRQLNPERLYVKNDQLCYTPQGGATPVPLQGYDYMLFRIEGRQERDDWRLKNIVDPLQQAIMAFSQGETARATAYKTVALATAWQSPDLAVYDRRRVVDAIKEELAQIEGGGLGAVGEEVRDLNAIMAARAMPIEQSAALGELTADEVFAE